MKTRQIRDLSKLGELKAEFDSLIRSGEGAAVRARLEAIKPKDLPRDHLADFAVIARRVDLIEWALRALKPVVLPEKRWDKPASPKEAAVYASALSRVGAVGEAISILLPLENEPLPEISLYTAFAHIHEWDYASAIPRLQAYLKFADLTDYERLIGKLNLAAAYRYTVTQTSEHDKLIPEIIETARENGWSLLLRNGLELAGQAAMASGKWDEAERYLREATDLSSEKRMDGFFLRKWKVLLDLHRDGPLETHLNELFGVREEADRLQDWETVRECDYYRSTLRKDPQLCMKVYFGTPFARYRERIEQQASAWMEFPSSYNWRVGGPAAERSFDVEKGEEIGGSAKMKSGQALHRFLCVLASDFYRPFQKGFLFARLYPGEHYDPDSSPARIKMAATHLRKWFQESGVPLAVRNEEGLYRFIAEGPYQLLVPATLADAAFLEADPKPQWLERLRDTWPYKSFTTKQAMDVLSVSASVSAEETRDFLKWAEESGLLRRIGRGRGTSFTFSE